MEEIIVLFKKAVIAEQKSIYWWYRYAESFQEKLERKRIEKKRKKINKGLATEIYDELMEQMEEYTRDYIIKNTSKAMKIYKLFSEIGIEIMQEMKEIYAKDIINLKEIEIDQIVKRFKGKV
jgi:hypothetical protein